jgi:hypothetical protein
VGSLWKGSATLVYPSGGDGTGFTADGPVDIAKFVFSPKALGGTSMRLTRISATGFNPETVMVQRIGAYIVNGDAETDIRSKFDLNRDNKVDALDLSVALLYFGHKSTDTDWTALVKVKDVKGGDITPAICDVNGDNVVDMLDLMEIYLNYFPK